MLACRFVILETISMKILRHCFFFHGKQKLTRRLFCIATFIHSLFIFFPASLLNFIDNNSRNIQSSLTLLSLIISLCYFNLRLQRARDCRLKGRYLLLIEILIYVLGFWILLYYNPNIGLYFIGASYLVLTIALLLIPSRTNK